MKQRLDRSKNRKHINRVEPKQRRSKSTVSTILQATTQVLERPDGQPSDTNAIAARAGFSVGTLYRYFPNKRAILQTLALREMERQSTRQLQMLAETADRPVEETISRCAEQIIMVLGGSATARRRLLLALVDDQELMAKGARLQRQVLAAIAENLHRRAPERFRALSEVDELVVGGAVMGAVRATIMTEPERLTDPAFKAALQRLITVSLSHDAGG